MLGRISPTTTQAWVDVNLAVVCTVTLCTETKIFNHAVHASIWQPLGSSNLTPHLSLYSKDMTCPIC